MSKHLAVILPGSRYEPIGPATHVPFLALSQLGAERRVVRYGDDRPETLERRDVVPFAESLLPVIVDACAGGGVLRVTFVAKSLGTLVLAAIAGDIAEQVAERVAVSAIWITPLFGLDYVRDGAANSGWPSLVVSGDADEYFDRAGDEAVAAATGGRSLVLAGADHGLDVENNVAATIEGWKRVAEAVLGFAGYD